MIKTETTLSPADLADQAYGPHPRNVLDLWRSRVATPAPLLIWIHGGGFMQGDKTHIERVHVERYLADGFAVASINYRLTDSAPFPAQMLDGALALQWIRLHATDVGIDPLRVACAGDSAGGGISQWLAFHADCADPESNDPLLRQSTRIQAVGVMNSQCSYDPRLIRNIVPGNAHQHRAMKRLFAVGDDFDWDREAISDATVTLMDACGPLSLLRADAPPAFICGLTRAEQTGNIHHPNLSRHLAEHFKKLGIDHQLLITDDFAGTKSGIDAYDALREFLRERL